MFRVINVTKECTLARRAKPAFSFSRRLIGLLGRRSLLEEEGLIIEPCLSVHTFFMRFSIDVVFYDRSRIVIAVFSNLTPFRVTPVLKSALGVVELPKGTILFSQTEIGDQLSFDAASDR